MGRPKVNKFRTTGNRIDLPISIDSPPTHRFPSRLPHIFEQYFFPIADFRLQESYHTDQPDPNISTTGLKKTLKN